MEKTREISSCKFWEICWQAASFAIGKFAINLLESGCVVCHIKPKFVDGQLLLKRLMVIMGNLMQTKTRMKKRPKTVGIVYFATPVFTLFLYEILIKFKTQLQFLNCPSWGFWNTTIPYILNLIKFWLIYWYFSKTNFVFIFFNVNYLVNSSSN